MILVILIVVPLLFLAEDCGVSVGGEGPYCENETQINAAVGLFFISTVAIFPLIILGFLIEKMGMEASGIIGNILGVLVIAIVYFLVGAFIGWIVSLFKGENKKIGLKILLLLIGIIILIFSRVGILILLLVFVWWILEKIQEQKRIKK